MAIPGSRNEVGIGVIFHIYTHDPLECLVLLISVLMMCYTKGPALQGTLQPTTFHSTPQNRWFCWTESWKSNLALLRSSTIRHTGWGGGVTLLTENIYLNYEAEIMVADPQWSKAGVWGQRLNILWLWGLCSINVSENDRHIRHTQFPQEREFHVQRDRTILYLLALSLWRCISVSPIQWT